MHLFPAVKSLVRPAYAALALAFVLLAPASAFGLDQPGEPRQRLTVKDNRRASSVVTRKSDLLPSYRVDATGGALPSIPHCGEYPGDRSSITITGSARAGFINGGSTIGSTGIFFKNQLNLEAYWRATVRAEYATCFAELYAKGRREGVVAETLEAGPTRIGPTGATRVAAFRIVTRLSAEGSRTFDWYQTIVFISTGRGLAMIRVASADHACDCFTGLATDAARRLRAAR
jgi:hypothetical protein